jgi:hypothetical protein
MRSWIRRLYGAGPLHLLALLACFSLVGYAVTYLTVEPELPRVLIWFVAAVIAHDLIAYPLYTLADRTLRATLTRLHLPRGGPPVLNYIRVPALASALLFVVYFPGIIRQGGGAYYAASGHTQRPFLVRWLLLTAILFTVSVGVYIARVAYAHRGKRR